MNSCRDCKERHINCHANCEKYIKWKMEHDKQVKLRRSAENKYTNYFYHK